MASSPAPLRIRTCFAMIRSTTRKPPFDIVRCSHPVLGATDLGASERFYAQQLGYIVTERTADTLYLRNLECRTHHSLVLQRLGEPACQALAWKVASEDDLDRAKRWFQGKGLPATFVERHGQGRTLRTCDTLGMPLEFYSNMASAPCKLQQYDDYRGARIQRLDHINCFSPDVQKSYEFWSLRIGLPSHRVHGVRGGKQCPVGGVAATEGRRS